LTLEDLLDNLLFFNQESTNNTVSNTVSTTGSTIGTADGFLGLGDSSKFTRTKSLDLYIKKLSFLHLYLFHATYTSEGLTTVTTTGSLDGLLLVVVDEVAT
jgi:hypothetical protein